MSKVDFLVSVRCFTYNHAPYITDSLNGFAMQRTSFPYVCIIVDDASSDSEPQIIRNYLAENFNLCDENVARNEENDDYELFFARHKDNGNCYFAVYLLKYNHYRKKDKFQYFSEFFDSIKYHALCEGDDFWIDPQKLQKQVDFMENNPDFGMVHTDFDLVKGRRNHPKPNPDVFVFPDLLTRQFGIGTATVLYRNAVYQRIPRYFEGKNWSVGDLPMWIELSHESKVKFLSDVTAKYRVLDLSASHFSDIDKAIHFIDTAYFIRSFYAEKYNVDIDVYDEKYYEELIRTSAHYGEKDKARQFYLDARKRKKLSFRSLIFYASSQSVAFKRMLSAYIEV